jgi:DNA (cytosine-5)-methyltransferase 1
MRRNGDARNSLVSVFANIVARARPTAFVFENVEGFLTAEDGQRVMDLLSPLISAGYMIHLRKINAANYGIPQHRKRVLAIGGLGFEPPFPEATHAAYGAPGAWLGGAHDLPRTPTLRDAIFDLPPPSMNGDQPSVPDHVYRTLVAADLERAILLREGQTMRDLPEDLQHDSYRRRAYRRVLDGMPSEKRGGAPAGIRRLIFDQPCKAITGGARSEFLHPTEHRNLTLRECARVQTFQDGFCFFGSTADRATLIGNAVPPKLAEVFGRSLGAAIAHLGNTARPKQGRLLSFVPTLSEGMSPALERTVDMVSRAFSTKPTERQLALWH